MMLRFATKYRVLDGICVLVLLLPVERASTVEIYWMSYCYGILLPVDFRTVFFHTDVQDCTGTMSALLMHRTVHTMVRSTTVVLVPPDSVQQDSAFFIFPEVVYSK